MSEISEDSGILGLPELQKLFEMLQHHADAGGAEGRVVWKNWGLRSLLDLPSMQRQSCGLVTSMRLLLCEHPHHQSLIIMLGTHTPKCNWSNLINYYEYYFTLNSLQFQMTFNDLFSANSGDPLGAEKLMSNPYRLLNCM